jgi:hypothetical protein
MAQLAETIERCDQFADRLNALGNDGRFGDAERFGFVALHRGYFAALRGFFLSPCCGAQSARYDPALSAAETGLAIEAVPGEADSQQPLYDAANAGIAALKAATAGRVAVPKRPPRG